MAAGSAIAVVALGVSSRGDSFWEASRDSRSLDYPFTIIQMRIDSHGKGEGKMSVATKVIPTGNTIVLENYDNQPVLLSAVTVEG